MLNILEVSKEKLTTLNHGPNVFHDALEKVRDGEERFHVTDPKGKVEDYDLAFTENMMLFPDNVRGLVLKMTNGGATYAPFLQYDEDDTDNLCLDFLKQFNRIEIESIDEYSLGVARIAIKYTDLNVYTPDGRITWFIEDADRVHVVESLSSETDKKTLRMTPSPFEMGYSTRDWSYISSLTAFQNIFLWQAFTVGRKGPFKYIEVVLSKIAGVGAILANLSIASNAGAPRGLTAFLRPGCTRYPESLLCRYFHINPKPADATEDNCIVLEKLFAVFTTSWYACQFPANFDLSIFDEKFVADMKEYADTILGGKKTLGVLARGTDYVTANLGADRVHATPDQMISIIGEWIEEDGYEKIFLATEDIDNLEKIKAAFPGKVIAIAQERMRISDLEKLGTTLIYEYEQKANHGQAYYDTLEDTTVNYFYALYILSRCDSFLCSGQCNGWDTVRTLKEGKFERERKLKVVIEGDPFVEKWKEIRPVTAGMFAKGSYLTNKAFYMTYRFDMADHVNPEALRKAWDKTIAIYPYVTYAETTRNGKLVLLENKLPFVIEETSEVIEPYERAGNFHSVTFCYLGKVLWMYVDHVPYDGTGFKSVLETFFYHYYCELDKKEYPVPDGVFTEKDGVVAGQDTDAYLMSDPIDPKAMMAAYGRSKSFEIKEAFRDEAFSTREDCRGYCISIPGDEFMTYARSVNGSPMSLLAVFLAKAMQKVHPENTLPVDVTAPVSIRKVMGNPNSLLHQVVHAPYSFMAEDLKNGDEVLNQSYREFLNGYSSEQNIKMLCGVYRSICEGYAKAFSAGALDNIVLESRSSAKIGAMVSYLGTLRTDEYGSRIRMTAFHAMQEKGVMVQ
ncbi:MAG: hypothetical protein IKN47_07210, partial [Lachnospiraceae bacterium]|nr:hypothetical protein [Lachnospiraceae bacterium]